MHVTNEARLCEVLERLATVVERLANKFLDKPTEASPATPPGRPSQPPPPAPEGYYSFDEALQQLNIDERRLKRLISEGEIRAFREGDRMIFKKAEIDRCSGKHT